jgi:hypothetical protein
MPVARIGATRAQARSCASPARWERRLSIARYRVSDTVFFPGEGRRDLLLGEDTYRAGYARAADAAVAIWVLGEILLVVLLGEVEGRGLP